MSGRVLDVPSTQTTKRARLMLSATHRASQEIPTKNLHEIPTKILIKNLHDSGPDRVDHLPRTCDTGLLRP